MITDSHGIFNRLAITIVTSLKVVVESLLEHSNTIVVVPLGFAKKTALANLHNRP